jgi:hypothetical protein
LPGIPSYGKIRAGLYQIGDPRKEFENGKVRKLRKNTQLWSQPVLLETRHSANVSPQFAEGGRVAWKTQDDPGIVHEVHSNIRQSRVMPRVLPGRRINRRLFF